MLFREIDLVLGAVRGVRRGARARRRSRKLLARVAADPAMLREIIADLPRGLPQAARRDPRRPGCRRSQTRVYRAAHTLKGSVGNFQAQEIVAHLQRLEARAREGDIATCRRIFDQIETEHGPL